MLKPEGANNLLVEGVISVRYILILAFVVVSVSCAEAQFQNELIGFRFTLGQEYGYTFGSAKYRDKLAEFGGMARSSPVDETEAFFTFLGFGSSEPTGNERFGLGFTARADRDDRPEPIRSDEPVSAKMSLTLSYRTDFGDVYLDKALSREADGVPWYDRVRLENADIKLWQNAKAKISLSLDAKYDWNPLVGFQHKEALSFRNDEFKVEIGQDNWLFSFGIGF